MRLSAVGVGARRNRDNTITVLVDIRDGERSLGRREFSGKDLNAIRELVGAELQRRFEAERDATLNAAVVGQVLASVSD